MNHPFSLWSEASPLAYHVGGLFCVCVLYFLHMKNSEKQGNFEVIISNFEKLAGAGEAIKRGGPENLHVLADFDRTLTTAFVDGKSVPSLISILRDGNYLTTDYAEKAHALANKYHPIETDMNISFDEKWKAMDTWWREHSKLLIESGLKKYDLEKVAISGGVRLRDGFSEFAEILRTNNIPLVIMSASGIGTESISLFLKHVGALSSNVHIISNEYEWDKEGKASMMKEPIIHSLSKYETAIQNYSVFNVIENRRNVILLGDSVDDLGMVKGFDYDNLITIGFLNDKVEENREHYKKVFDVVLTGDADMIYVNKLLSEVVE